MKRLFSRLFRSERGAISVVAALIITTALGVIGIAIDFAGQMEAQIMAQKSLDAALLAGVATSTTIEVKGEVTKVFRANYPTNFLGSEIIKISVDAPTKQIYSPTPSASGPSSKSSGAAAVMAPAAATNPVPSSPLPPGQAYTGEFSAYAIVRYHNHVMNMFGFDFNDIRVDARVINILQESQIKGEVVLVLDTTGSMAGQPIVDLRTAAHVITDILFGGRPSEPNLFLSVVSYNTATGIDPTVMTQARTWFKPFYQPRYDAEVATFGKAFMANRNEDIPKTSVDDVTIVAPTQANPATLFRTPSHFVGNPYPYNPQNTFPPIECNDIEYYNIAPMLFAESVKQRVDDRIDMMMADGCTRIDVGFQKGMLMLAPTWQGVWDTTKPTLPLSVSSAVSRHIILMTDGLNTVMTGQNANITNDDALLLSMCTAAKNSGITVYTITLGPSVNAALMQACATSGNYYHAPSSNQLVDIFQAIGSRINQEWLRLSR